MKAEIKAPIVVTAHPKYCILIGNDCQYLVHGSRNDGPAECQIFPGEELPYIEEDEDGYGNHEKCEKCKAAYAADYGSRVFY